MSASAYKAILLMIIIVLVAWIGTTWIGKLFSFLLSLVIIILIGMGIGGFFEVYLPIGAWGRIFSFPLLIKMVILLIVLNLFNKD